MHVYIHAHCVHVCIQLNNASGLKNRVTIVWSKYFFLVTINQLLLYLLFSMTLFLDLPEINWFTTTIFCVQSMLNPYSFWYNTHKAKTSLRREIFATKRISRISQKFLAREKKLVYSISKMEMEKNGKLLLDISCWNGGKI